MSIALRCIVGAVIVASILGGRTPRGIQAAEPRVYRVLPIGDSITVGYTDNPQWTFPFDFGYRGKLYELLQNDGLNIQYVGDSPEPQNGAFGRPTVVAEPNLASLGQDKHEGRGGARTADVQANVSRILNTYEPDIILLMIGINDIRAGSDMPPTTAMVNLNSIVRTIVSRRPSAKLIIAQTIPYTAPTPAIRAYNAYIRETLVPAYAAQGAFVFTVDQHSPFVLASGDGIDASLYSNGKNHPNTAGYAKMAHCWHDGIRAIDLDAKAADGESLALAANLVKGGGFESPALRDASHNVAPKGGVWTFTKGGPGAGAGIDRGNPYGPRVANSSSADGDQMAFIQSSGSGAATVLSQRIDGLTADREYRLTFQAKGMEGVEGCNPIGVKLNDGTKTIPLFGGKQIVPSTADYLPYAAVFTATAPTITLSFFDQGTDSTGKVTWIDSVAITAMPQANDGAGHSDPSK